MRVSAFVFTLVAALSAPAAAQEWIEYTSKQDLFIVNFPGEPTIRDMAYPSEFGITLPARVYTVETQGSRFRATSRQIIPKDKRPAFRLRHKRNRDRATDHSERDLSTNEPGAASGNQRDPRHGFRRVEQRREHD